MIDKVVENVIDKFRERSEKGIKKYGTTLADNNLTEKEWLNHAQEEAMDFVVYLEKIKQLRQEFQKKEDKYWDEEHF